MALSDREADWISKRGKRWAILLELRNGKISVLEAERRLRELDGR